MARMIDPDLGRMQVLSDRSHRRRRPLRCRPRARAISWLCLHEFFAIATHRRIYDPPTPPVRAIEQIEAWLESPSLVLLAESDRHWAELRALLTRGKIAGTAVHDARVAALCLQHGVRELWSADHHLGYRQSVLRKRGG